ncbi:hypothetical protein CJ030_MR0G002901 [Morella rubra]|uniref:Uncharacterized protein n=1 Tax=Morella rubra TaxID=262757 RepID=A0A6A1UM73_9ROSI|nr:hypothetical protein CJ030_MR0G002901 [Morella rubra]
MGGPLHLSAAGWGLGDLPLDRIGLGEVAQPPPRPPPGVEAPSLWPPNSRRPAEGGGILLHPGYERSGDLLHPEYGRSGDLPHPDYVRSGEVNQTTTQGGSPLPLAAQFWAARGGGGSSPPLAARGGGGIPPPP